MNKREKEKKKKRKAEKHFKKQWNKFIAYQDSQYDCRSNDPSRPFLIDDGKKDYLIVFIPHNIDDYLRLRITEELYKKFKKAGITDL